MNTCPSSSAGRIWLRAVLMGPLVLVAACLTMAGGALWLPHGRAQVNHLVLPLVIFPLIWTGLFLYSSLDRRLLRAFAVVGLVTVINAALLAWHLLR